MNLTGLPLSWLKMIGEALSPVFFLGGGGGGSQAGFAWLEMFYTFYLESCQRLFFYASGRQILVQEEWLNRACVPKASQNMRNREEPKVFQSKQRVVY